MIKHALKIKVRFDKETEAILDSQSRIVNWLHNHLLEKANSLKEEFIQSGSKESAKTLYTARGLRNLVPQLKEEHPFLKTVHSSPLKNKALELSRSIQTYQKSKKDRSCKKVGWPSFHSQKKKWCSLYYDEPNKGFKADGCILSVSLGQTIEGKRLKVQGVLEINPSQLKGDKILTFRLIKEGGFFYAIFTVERKMPEKKKLLKVIALDPNHKNLAYGVGNDKIATEIKNPWFLKPLDKTIDALKQRRDRCQRKSKKLVRPDGKSHWLPSRRWVMFDRKLKKLYQKRRDQSKVFLYSVANHLFKQYDLVAIGNYTPSGGGINRGMRRAMNNESLIGRFKEVLSWVALRSGKHYDEWNEYNSTKTCSSCQHILPRSINPSIREWQCPECQEVHHRDENAAKNGLRKILQLPCLGLQDNLEIRSRRAWKYNGLGVLETPGVIIGVSA